MDVSIRQATPVDLTAITLILDQAVSSKAFHGDLAWGDKAYDDSSLTAAITRGSLFLATADGQIVATFRLDLRDDNLWGPQPPDAMYLNRFATASGYRGQNLGRQIFDLIAPVVLAHNRSFIRLICPSKNGKLAAYHESNGFVRVDFKAKPLHGGASAIYYEKLVDPNYQEPKAQSKSGFFGRLRGR